MKRLAPLMALALSACASTSAVKADYGFEDIRRIGITRFDAAAPIPLAAEDVFAKHLLRRGFNVVERLKVEAVLAEQHKGLSGLYHPRTAKKVGRLLGVDALLMGTVTHHIPARRKVVTTRHHNVTRVPVMEYQPVGSGDQRRFVMRQVAVNETQDSREVPYVMEIEAEVGLAAKLVHVETGEVLWVGSASDKAADSLAAVEAVAGALVRRLRKDWAPSFVRR